MCRIIVIRGIPVPTINAEVSVEFRGSSFKVRVREMMERGEEKGAERYTEGERDKGNTDSENNLQKDRQR